MIVRHAHSCQGCIARIGQDVSIGDTLAHSHIRIIRRRLRERAIRRSRGGANALNSLNRRIAARARRSRRRGIRNRSAQINISLRHNILRCERRERPRRNTGNTRRVNRP